MRMGTFARGGACVCSWIDEKGPLLQSSLSSCSGRHPGFQKLSLSSHEIHSSSEQDKRRNARLSSPSRLYWGSTPSENAWCQSTCICRISLRAASGLSKFISQISRNSDNHTLVSFRRGSLMICLLEPDFLPKGHHPIMFPNRRLFSSFLRIWKKNHLLAEIWAASISIFMENSKTRP